MISHNLVVKLSISHRKYLVRITHFCCEKKDSLHIAICYLDWAKNMQLHWILKSHKGRRKWGNTSDNLILPKLWMKTKAISDLSQAQIQPGCYVSCTNLSSCCFFVGHSPFWLFILSILNCRWSSFSVIFHNFPGWAQCKPVHFM